MPTNVYYLPTGPKNLKAIFPSLNFKDIEEYIVQVLTVGTDGSDAQAIIDVTPLTAWEPGTVVHVQVVEDPVLAAIVTLGTYVTVVGDNVASVLAQHIAEWIESLPSSMAAFVVTYAGNTVICTAPPDYGSIMNGQLFVLDWTDDHLEDDFGGGLDDTQIVIATTPNYINEHECDDDIHIHFVNYLGQIDSVPFKLINIEHVVKSELFQVSTKQPLIKNVHGTNRINIKIDEPNTAQAIFNESDMDWLQELYDSPFTWIEWKGTQGQADDYLPIVISDQKVTKKKVEDRFQYLVDIEFTPSNEKIPIRG